MSYDSTQGTKDHIEKVREYLNICASQLRRRGAVHDRSKLISPEKDFFDKYTPLLASLDYGSDEYRQALDELKPALEHHYQKNSHHPEHYENGIDGMDLFDVIEMLMDWKAASERHNSGDIWKSLEHNKSRFNIDDQLYGILCNTAKGMGW